MSTKTTWQELAGDYKEREELKAGFAPKGSAEDWRTIQIVQLQGLTGAALKELKGYLTEFGYVEIPADSRRTKVERFTL
jgi:hypothetical protein